MREDTTPPWIPRPTSSCNKAFEEIGGVVHTHSPMAAAWAQAERGIPCYGTTQADYFYGEVPCCRTLTPEEVADEYEKNQGLAIVETFRNRNLKSHALSPAWYVPTTAPSPGERTPTRRYITRGCWRKWQRCPRGQS